MPQTHQPETALTRSFHEAKASNAPKVDTWGTGTPRREFLYVDDMAAASVQVMDLPKARRLHRLGKLRLEN